MQNFKRLILAGGASAIMAVMGLTGCSMFQEKSSDRSAGRQLDDKVITEQVEEKLQNEPVYKFSDVDVKTFAGVVQLSGFVNNDDQKRRAGELAQRVEGVSRVINNIALKPGSELTPTGATNQMNRTTQP
jgi:osmotically-inducible protein OsmY